MLVFEGVLLEKRTKYGNKVQFKFVISCEEFECYLRPRASIRALYLARIYNSDGLQNHLTQRNPIPTVPSLAK